MATTETLATIKELSAADYHADLSAISKSMLSEFHRRPAMFKARYLDKTLPPKQPSEDMEIGSAVHLGLLEPDKFSAGIVEYPADVLAKNGAVSTNAARDFRDENRAAGRIVLKRESMQLVRTLVDALKTACGKWLERPAKFEQSIYWTHEETQILCKMRADWVIDTPNVVIVPDIKTTANASPFMFRKRAEDFDYWLQHATYCEGIQAAYGKPAMFFFIVVELDQPNAVGFYRLDDESAAKAVEARQTLMRRLADCLDTDEWREPWEQEITPLAIRPWAFE